MLNISPLKLAKKLLLCFFMIGYCSTNSHSMENKTGQKSRTTQDIYPEIREHTLEGVPYLYQAKIKGKDLWLVMELIDSEYIERWQKYISVQTASQIIEVAGTLLDDKRQPVQKGSIGDGSKHFSDVLNKVNHKKTKF